MLHKRLEMFTLLLAATICFAGCGQAKEKVVNEAANKGISLLQSLNSQDISTMTNALETATTTALAELTKTSGSPGGDFMYDLTEDGSGIIIKKYTGNATTLIIPDSIEGYPVVEIGRSAAKASNIQVLIIPSTVKVIQDSAFYESSVVSVVILPNESGAGGLKEIRASAFEYCRQLKTVSLPDSIEEIYASAFSSCSSLYRINIPANIKFFGKKYVIGGAVFTDCIELYELTIPENIQNITWEENQEGSSYPSFAGCGKLPLATRKKLKDLGYKGEF